LGWREKLLQPYIRNLLAEALRVAGWSLVWYSRKTVRVVNHDVGAPVTEMALTLRVPPENCSLTRLMWHICSDLGFEHWQRTSWEAWL